MDFNQPWNLPMRHPLSVYARSIQRDACRLSAKIQRRLRKFTQENGDNTPKPSRAARVIVDKAAIATALTDLGLGSGDTVMVHSGISNLGKITGGPQAVFNLIAEQVGGEGHMLYPVFPFNTLMYGYLASHPVFDAANSPSKMGSLSEYALRTPGGQRSLHPSHSILAFGPRAGYFVGEHHLCRTPFADLSPFARLVEAKGKILLIGVDLNSTTSFHRTEDRMGNDFPVKVYVDEIFEVSCVDTQGQGYKVITQAHDPFISRIRDCELVRNAFIRAGVIREAKVGSGVLALIDAALMDQTLENLWRQERFTIYGRIWG